MRKLLTDSEKEYIKMAENFLKKDMQERYGDFVTFNFGNESKIIDIKEYEELMKQRDDWGYDSLCFRFEQVVNELIYCKARTPEAKEAGHYMDFEYYKKRYDRNKIRFYQVLDEVLGGIHNDKPNL